MISSHAQTREYLHERMMQCLDHDPNSMYSRLLKKQLAFILARQQISVEVEDPDLANCLNNIQLSEHFISLARELDVLEPKTPEDIYKSHLENIRKLARYWLLPLCGSYIAPLT